MTLKLMITVANSIIGVSILAMPFCFQQCGILLSIVALAFSGFLVKQSCHLLVKSANLTKCRNYEELAKYTFGPLGKLAIEVCMVGYMMGTCIAFFVVIGDLAPPIIANILTQMTGKPYEDANLRMEVLVFVAIFVITPLSLLKKLKQLSAICAMSIIFYVGVTFYITSTSWNNLWKHQWTETVNWWKFSGVLQCMSIFTMALSCQAQIFEVYNDLQDASIHAMNGVVRGAVNLCTGLYLTVGLFGYIALYHYKVPIEGNILTAYDSTSFLEMLRILFGVSVALSFPLVIFPCRTSIHSLLFRNTGYKDVIKGGQDFIPPNRWNTITIVVIAITLVVGILIPDIEFVLGIVGSTIGNIVCLILPSVIFLKITTRDTFDRLSAKFILVCGILIMVVGTYKNLHVEDNKNHEKLPPPIMAPIDKPIVEKLPPIDVEKKPDIGNVDKPLVEPDKPEENNDNIRVEPVVPNPPSDEKDNSKKDFIKDDDTKKIKPEGEGKEKIEKEQKESDKKEQVEQAKEEIKEKEEKLKVKEEKADKLIKALEKQKVEHQQIIDEQKEVLDQMKQHLDKESKKSDDNLQQYNQQNQVLGGQQQQQPLQPQVQQQAIVNQQQQIPQQVPQQVPQQQVPQQVQQVPQQQIPQQQVQQVPQQQVPQQQVPQQQVPQQQVPQQQVPQQQVPQQQVPQQQVLQQQVPQQVFQQQNNQFPGQQQQQNQQAQYNQGQQYNNNQFNPNLQQNQIPVVQNQQNQYQPPVQQNHFDFKSHQQPIQNPLPLQQPNWNQQNDYHQPQFNQFQGQQPPQYQQNYSQERQQYQHSGGVQGNGIPENQGYQPQQFQRDQSQLNKLQPQVPQTNLSHKTKTDNGVVNNAQQPPVLLKQPDQNDLNKKDFKRNAGIMSDQDVEKIGRDLKSIREV